MSFSENVKKELSLFGTKLTCCRKAFAYGALMNSFPAADGSISFASEQAEVLEAVKNAFTEQFRAECNVEETSRFGHRRYILSFKSSSASELLLRMGSGTKLSEIVGFRCENCRISFLRGLFLASANVSDPMKMYHLEFSLKNAERAKLVFEELREAGFEAKIANRKNGIGLYFKDSGSIEDILTYLGASKMLFECMNDKILREIRNDTNRRANCETGNIMKAVNASQDILSSIKRIEEAGLFGTLSEDLRVTAEIRREYPEASLTELCGKFSPTLSKSGLNHRLQRIKKIAEEIGKK